MNFRLKYIFLMILLIFSVTKGDAQNENDGTSFVYAQKLYNDGMYELAAEQFHQFAEQNENSPQASQAILMSGKSYFAVSEFLKSKKEFVYLIVKFPESEFAAEAQFLLAKCFMEMNELHSAAKTYRQVAIFYPKSKFADESLFKSAQMFKKAGDSEKANEVLYEILQTHLTNPFYHEARLLLADIYFETGKYDQSEAQLNRLLGDTEKGVINAKGLLQKAKLHLEIERLQEAENLYQNLISSYQNQSNNREIGDILNQAYLNLSRIYNKKGLFDLAIQNLERISNYMQNKLVLYQIGEIYFNGGNYSSAIKVLNQIFDVVHSDSILLAKTHFKLGECYGKLKDFSRSNYEFEQVIISCETGTDNEIIQLCEKSYINISENYSKLKNAQQSIRYLNKLLDIIDSSYKKEIIEYKIVSFYEHEIGNVTRAIQGYYDFMDRYPKSRNIDDAQLAVGRCFEKKKDYQQAIIEYQNLMNYYQASEFYPLAQSRIEYIENHLLVKQNAIHELGKLLQQSLISDYEVTPIKIGLFYFDELKDYRSAANLLKDAYLKKESYPKLDILKLIYYLGRSYQMIADKMAVENYLKQSVIDSAVQYFDMVINNASDVKLSEDAAFYRTNTLKINAAYNRSDSSRSLYKDALNQFRYKYPNSEYLDIINLKLAKLILQKDVETAVDSFDVINCCNFVLEKSDDPLLKAEAQFYKAQLYDKMGYDSKVFDVLENLLDQFSNSHHSCEAYWMLARISEKMGNFKNAEKYLKRIMINYFYTQRAEEATIKIGQILKTEKKSSEAINYYKQILDKYYQINSIQVEDTDQLIYENALIEIGKLTQIKGLTENAIDYYRMYLDQFPRGQYADEALYSLGTLFSLPPKNHPDQAISYLKQLKSDHNASEYIDSTLIKLGDLYFIKNDYANANDFYNEFINKGHPNLSKTYSISQIVIGLYKMGEIAKGDQALKNFKDRFNYDDQLQAKIKLEKGNYYLKNKDFKKAEKIFKEVSSSFKETNVGIKASFFLGKLYFTLNKDDEALQILTKIVEKFPENEIIPQIYISLGNFYYLQAKQIQSALLAYKKATEVDKIDQATLKLGMNNLIKCYTDLGMEAQALPLINEYVEKFPTAEDVFEKRILMGIIYYKLKEYDYAIEYLTKLKREADIENEPRIQYWIGECYFGKGQFKQSVSEYLKVAYLSRPTKLNWGVTAQYKAGIAYMKADEYENARNIFKKIVTEQGGESVFGKPAKEKIDEINTIIANVNFDR